MVTVTSIAHAQYMYSGVGLHSGFRVISDFSLGAPTNMKSLDWLQEIGELSRPYGVSNSPPLSTEYLFIY